MRGTLHALTPDDLRLILPLTRNRVIGSLNARHRELEITDADVAAASRAAESALTTGSDRLSRKELFAVFEAAGQRTTGQRGIHLAFLLANSGLLCLGPFAGSEQAWVLLDEWAPGTAHQVDRDEAIAEVALRYFRSHGPATVADFAWWTKLPLRDVRAAAAAVRDRLGVVSVDDVEYFAAPEHLELPPRAPVARSVFALPGFDEFLLGYTDRSAALDARYAPRIVPGNNGVFKPTIVAAGRVVGTWTRKDTSRSIDVTAQLFRDVTVTEMRRLTDAFERYSAFREKQVRVTTQSTP